MIGKGLGMVESPLEELRFRQELGSTSLDYNLKVVNGTSKAVIWLRGEIKSPPFTEQSRREMGTLLRVVQDGESLGMPQISTDAERIGPRCHELRVADAEHQWRLIYRIDPEAIVVVDVFAKTTPKTPKHIIEACKARLKAHDGP